MGRRNFTALTGFVLVVIGILVQHAAYANASIFEKLRDDPDLSQTHGLTSLRSVMPVRFYSLLEQNPVANSTLSLRSCTIFVPTNEAFQMHRGNTHVLYHIATVAMTKEQLTKTVTTDMDGNPSLFITKNREGDIYVNNAKIIPSLSVQMTNSQNKKQVMHVIDTVLEPLTTTPNSKIEINNPDAFEFLKLADNLDIGDNRVWTYRTQVISKHKENLYQSPGSHTFFIPVDKGFKVTTRSFLVDNKVIDGHVIPNNVLFTNAAQIAVPQTTAAFEDNIKVTASFFMQDGKLYAKSHTLVGGTNYTNGVVLAEIVKANLPVRNGVVHLIHKPLMIVDNTGADFLRENENGAVRKFYEAIMDNGGEILEDIKDLQGVTILVPSNDAWNSTSINNIIRNREKMREILNMHIVKNSFNVEKIKHANQNMIAQVPTAHNRTFLYFNVNQNAKGDDVITVEGGGVNATLVQPDVALTNGFVHIIDKVLGVPYTTVLGKLESDPMLSDSYKIGELSEFNEQLNNTQRRFTYFVARDKGWQKNELDYPSVHKKMFMKDFSYHSRSILERHLVIADQVYTMKDLAKISATQPDDVVLPTFRDSLKLRVLEEAGRYVILWNFKKINVYRPDVECTNGIIHVIDYPLLEERDIVVSGGSYQITTNYCILFCSNVLMMALAKLFLF